MNTWKVVVFVIHLVIGAAYAGVGVLVQTNGDALTRKDKILAVYMALGYLVAANSTSPFSIRDPDARDRTDDPPK